MDAPCSCQTNEASLAVVRGLMTWEREDFRFFRNNRDNPPWASFLFYRPYEAKERRSAQGNLCGTSAILSATASLSFKRVLRLDHLHGHCLSLAANKQYQRTLNQNFI